MCVGVCVCVHKYQSRSCTITHCTVGLPLYEIVLWGELHLLEVSAEFRHGLMKEDIKGVKVRSHQSVVNSKERQVGGAVEKVGQTDEGIGCLHVEQEDSCQEGHALYIADVRTVTGVGT